MDIENETQGVNYQKLTYRIEGGKTHPLELGVRTFDLLLRVLDWTPAEFSAATGLAIPASLLPPPVKNFKPVGDTVKLP